MKDFNGKEVSVGDKVITLAKGYRGLISATVISVANKVVVVEYLNTWNYGIKGSPETYKVDSSMFIIQT